MKKTILFFGSPVLALLLGACVAHQGRPAEAPPAAVHIAQVALTKDVTYTPAGWPQALTADVYAPQGQGPFPGVITVHGGGWDGRTRSDMDDLSLQLARRGYVVMNVSYRLAPEYHFPAPVQDLLQAVVWLRTNSLRLPLRTDRIGIWGYSAGAHLASMVAVTGPGDRNYVEGGRVQALVAGGTPSDLRNYPDGKLSNKLMGVTIENEPIRWRSASPITLVSGDDPPAFLYHGMLDYTVGAYNSRYFYTAFKEAGVPAELMLLRFREHLLTAIADTPVEAGIEFLDRYLRQPAGR